VRFVTSDPPICFHVRPDRTANPFDWRDRRFTGHAGSIASGADGRSAVLSQLAAFAL